MRTVTPYCGNTMENEMKPRYRWSYKAKLWIMLGCTGFTPEVLFPENRRWSVIKVK